MSDMLDRAATWVQDKLGAHASQSITLYRMERSVVIAEATLGSQLLSITDERGVVRTVRTQLDVIFATDALDFGDGPVDPMPGDRVRLTRNSVLQEWEVASPGGFEPAWRYTSGYREAIRCHLKFRGPVS